MNKYTTDINVHHNKLRCTFHNVPTDVLNALRMTIVESIPIVALDRATVVQNISCLVHEMISLRMSLLPLYLSPTEMEELSAYEMVSDSKQYEFTAELKVDNQSSDLRMVTSHDIVLYDLKNNKIDESWWKERVPEVVLTCLAPKGYVHVRAHPVMNTGNVHARFQPTSCCTMVETSDREHTFLIESEVMNSEHRGMGPVLLMKKGSSLLKKEIEAMMKEDEWTCTIQSYQGKTNYYVEPKHPLTTVRRMMWDRVRKHSAVKWVQIHPHDDMQPIRVFVHQTSISMHVVLKEVWSSIHHIIETLESEWASVSSPENMTTSPIPRVRLATNRVDEENKPAAASMMMDAKGAMKKSYVSRVDPTMDLL